jgi:predicted Ser/Thr protein kinase
MEMFDVIPDALWLDRFVSRRALRNLGALRLFLCNTPDSEHEQAVLVGRVGADPAHVKRQLDALCLSHARLKHPSIARVAERASAGDMEFVVFEGDFATDLESVFAGLARRGATCSYAAGEGLALGLLDALAHAHACGEYIERIGACNILVDPHGGFQMFGFGGTLDRPGPGDAPQFEAPPQASTLPRPSRDLCAWTACLRAYRRFFVRPNEVERALRGQALDRAQAWLAENVASLEGTLLSARAPITTENARALLKRRPERLNLEDPERAFQSCLAQIATGLRRERARDSSAMEGHGERYVFEGRLGEGSTSTVFKAWDRQLRQHVAIKRLSPGGSAESVARLLREVRTLREVRHPHLVRGYELYEDRGHIGAVMEYVPGPTLREAMIADALDREQALEALSQVADALAELQRTGIIHRDVKPDNIILCAGRGAVLVDFGVAGGASLRGPGTATLTAPGRVLGELSYQAPELLSGGQADATADVFSLACTVCEVLKLERHADALSVVDEPLRTRLLSALSADRTRRPSAIELAVALRSEPDAKAPKRCVSLDGRGLWRADGVFVDLNRRSTLRRILAALARAHYEAPGRALSRAELFEAGWPGEQIDPRSEANRVYVAVAELRKLGLKGALESDGEGYLLTPEATRCAPGVG